MGVNRTLLTTTNLDGAGVSTVYHPVPQFLTNGVNATRGALSGTAGKAVVNVVGFTRTLFSVEYGLKALIDLVDFAVKSGPFALFLRGKGAVLRSGAVKQGLSLMPSLLTPVTERLGYFRCHDFSKVR
jgi:hypothetical protein